MRCAAVFAMMALSSMAAAEPVDQTVVLTNEVMDLYVYAPICGYAIEKARLDIYLLGTHMFWGEPVSQSEIEAARAREIALFGDNTYERTKKCRSVSANFGPTGHRVRNVVR